MKNIQLLELEGKLHNPIMEFLVEHNSYLQKAQTDAILSRGDTGKDDLRMILRAYNQHFSKFINAENNITFISNVIGALTLLKDEEVYQDLIEYLKTDTELIDISWSEGIYESLPLYWAIMDTNIDKAEKALYDISLNWTTKKVLCLGLVGLPQRVDSQELYQVVKAISERYLTYLLTTAELNQNQKNTLIEINLQGYLSYGGNYHDTIVQQIVTLESNSFTTPETVKAWFIKQPAPLFEDIYSLNASWEKLENVDKSSQEKLLLKRQVTKILNATKQFDDLYNRNDKLSVKYKDTGAVITDVKYKKVEKDLLAGKCEIV
jgi:hypothetical protein